MPKPEYTVVRRLAVQVEWEDIYVMGGWVDERQANKALPLLMYSLGYVLSAGPKYLRIFMTQPSPGRDGMMDEIGTVKVIPWRVIRTVRPLSAGPRMSPQTFRRRHKPMLNGRAVSA